MISQAINAWLATASTRTRMKVRPVTVTLPAWSTPTHQCDGGTIISITWSMLKLAGRWRGGNSLKVFRKFPT